VCAAIIASAIAVSAVIADPPLMAGHQLPVSDGGTGEMTSPAEPPEDHQVLPQDSQTMPHGLNEDPAGVRTAGDPQSPGPATRDHTGGTAAGTAGPPAAPGKPQRFLSQLWDAVSVRTVGLIIGILLLQVGFILSYVGAFHSPTPHRIPIAVVAPARESGLLVTKLNLIPSAPLAATAASSPAAACSVTTPSAPRW
jgi:hypothetical protein